MGVLPCVVLYALDRFQPILINRMELINIHWTGCPVIDSDS